MNGKFPSVTTSNGTTTSPSSSKSLLKAWRVIPFRCQDEMDEEMIWLENAHRPPPPPPAPPSTPVVKPHYQTKAVSQKHHHHLLQQLPQRLANGVHLARPEDYMWLDPSGRPTSPPRPTTPKNKAQSSRKVYTYMFFVPL